MTPNPTDLRRADAVLNVLLDRSGVGDELGQVKYSDQETWDDIRTCIAAAIRADDEAAGMVLVPKEPTDKMLKAGWNAIDWVHGDNSECEWDEKRADGINCSMKDDVEDAWDAMLAAHGGENG